MIIAMIVGVILLIWIATSVASIWIIMSSLLKPRNWPFLLMLVTIVLKISTNIPWMGCSAFVLFIIWGWLGQKFRTKLEPYKKSLEIAGWKYHQGKDGKYWYLPTDPELVKYGLEEAVKREFGKDWATRKLS
jgi:hypothetical protein